MDGVAPAAPAAAPAPVTNGATPPKPSGEAKAAPEESWEFKEDGKTVKLTKAEAQKRFAEAQYAKKRMQEAADEAKTLRAEQAKAKADREADAKLRKENRAEWLKKNEIEEESLAREVLERKLKEQDMHPAELALEKSKRENAELKKAEEARQSEAKQAEVTQTAKHITQWMIDGLNKAAATAGLGIGPREFHVIHSVAAEFGDAGVPLDADWHNRVIAEAKERIEGSYQKLESAVTAGLTGEALVNRLGKRVVDEVLKHRLEQIRGKKTFGQGKPAAEAPPVAKPSRYIDMRQAEAELRKASKL